MDHEPENPVVEGTSYLERDHLINDTSFALLNNRTTVHPTMSSPPPLTPPVTMNGQADPINDILNTPIPIPPPSRPMNAQSQTST